MIVRTRIFEYCDGKYKNLSDLARAMGISVSQIYRVREGTRNINQKFIVGAVKAFPEYKLSDLFYLAPESPTVTEDQQKVGKVHQVLEKFVSAVEEYGQNLKSHISAH
jgi:transcriptional regulator with XRE-family HTH domain